MNFDTLSEWAGYKGIHLLSSADFTHPVWWEETKKKLKESDKEGFYEYPPDGRAGHSGVGTSPGAKFVLGSEISCIYSQGGRMRRMHCLLYFPQKSDVEEFNSRLGKRANLRADGRPIIGLSAKQLLELALEVNEKAIFIPAHVWTPWFSLYGSNSGFDSIDEAFGDLAKYVYAVETGLSSDPAMNWRIPELDNRSIVSFSDAHSTPKISRELTIFDTDFDYDGLLKGLKKQKISGTIEFFPEEGKYHFTGHRNCSVRHSPSETAKRGIICPHCKKNLTIGVMHRVEDLADKKRPEGFVAKNRPKYKNLVPLIEIIAQSLDARPISPKVVEEYKKLVGKIGTEMNILLKATRGNLEKEVTTERIIEGIEKVRAGDIMIDPGYDGVFGTVKIWPDRPAGGPTKNAQQILVDKPNEPKLQAEGQGHLGFD